MLTEMSSIGRWNRRDLLRLSTAALFLSPASSSAQAASVDTIDIIPTPAQPEAFFVEEGLLRSDIRCDPSTNASVEGFPLHLALTISRIDNGAISPLRNANVDLWQCDALGLYSDQRSQSTPGLKFLRGYQITDLHGSVRFTTVYPGWITGRTPHLHFKVRLYEGASKKCELCSELFFDEQVTRQVYALPPYNSRPTPDTTNVADIQCAATGRRLMLQLAKDSTYALASAHIMVSVS